MAGIVLSGKNTEMRGTEPVLRSSKSSKRNSSRYCVALMRVSTVPGKTVQDGHLTQPGRTVGKLPGRLS